MPRSDKLENSETNELIENEEDDVPDFDVYKKILKKELPVLRFARESVVAKENISKGEKFTESNLTTKRPNTGQIPAKYFYKIIGKTAKNNIPKDKQLLNSDIS